jgi:RNA 2',3'-cyclic 3'-phosphodiesterase
MRTFIAIELPQALHPLVAQQQQQLAARLIAARQDQSISWTPPEKVHLTLRFLGETTAAQNQVLQTALATLVAQQKPFTLALGQVGSFPGWQAPTIFWLSIGDQDNALFPLQQGIEQIAQRTGFAAEEKPFRPHLTIGRMKRSITRPQVKQIGQILAQQLPIPAPQSPSNVFAVRTIVHMQSRLQPTGSIYTPIQRFNLAHP